MVPLRKSRLVRSSLTVRTSASPGCSVWPSAMPASCRFRARGGVRRLCCYGDRITPLDEQRVEEWLRLEITLWRGGGAGTGSIGNNVMARAPEAAGAALEITLWRPLPRCARCGRRLPATMSCMTDEPAETDRSAAFPGAAAERCR